MKNRTKKKTKAQAAKEARRAKAKAWKELSMRLRAEAGKCEICGSTERLNAHHVIHRKARKDLLLEEQNIAVLCARHHFALHRGHEAEFFAWLKTHKPDQFDWIMRQASLGGPFSS